VAWPTNPTPCVLEESTDFASTNWTAINAPVSVVGSNANVELPTQPGARFYRLKLQQSAACWVNRTVRRPGLVKTQSGAHLSLQG